MSKHQAPLAIACLLLIAACSSSRSPKVLDADVPSGGSGGLGNPDRDAGGLNGDGAITCVEGGSDDPEFMLPACEDEPIGTPDGGMQLACANITRSPTTVEPNPSCTRSFAAGTFTPVVEWEMASFGALPTNQIQSHPIVIDLDGDALPEIVVVAFGGGGNWGHVHAIRGDGSGLLFSVTDIEAEINAGIAAGDIDGDGAVELVVPARSGIYALEHDGSFKWQSEDLGDAIDRDSDTAAISDMNHDGSPEIIVGRAILNAEGEVIGEGEHGMGSKPEGLGTCSFAVDLDDDGEEEVITGNAAYRMDGSTIWHNGFEDGYPAVGNFDGDVQGEVVVAGSGVLRLLDTDGGLIWEEPIPGSSDERFGGGGPPTVADFDGDGAPEIGVASTSAYTVFEGDGSVLWSRAILDDSSSIAGASVFDFEADGVADVVYADETTLWVFDGRDGTPKLERTEHNNGTVIEYPVVADVDGDDHAEIVVVQSDFGFETGGGLIVYGDANDSWAPGRRTWNQHAYSITNVNDDGTIPMNAEPNWLTYNSFRAGHVPEERSLDAPDAFVHYASLCERCTERGFSVVAQVGNRGSAAIPAEALTIEVFGDDGSLQRTLATVVISETIAAGQVLGGLSIAVDELLGDFVSIGVRIEAVADDCQPANDVLGVLGPFCTDGPHEPS